MDALTTGAPAEQLALPPRLLESYNYYLRDYPVKSKKTYIGNLRQFFAWIRYKEIIKPTHTDIVFYREWLLSEHEAITLSFDAAGWSYRQNKAGQKFMITCRPSTVKQYIQSVKLFFKWTAQNGIYADIAAGVRTPKITDEHKKDFFTPAEVCKIESSIKHQKAIREAQATQQRKDTAGKLQRSTEQGKRLYAMYVLAVNAGLRTIELNRARIKDIETRNGKSYIYIHGKGHAEADQKKALAPEVITAINDYLSSRADNPTGDSPLFTATGNRSRGRAIAPTTISTMLKGAMIEAGYNSPRLTAHSLRHTTAQAVLNVTGDNIYKTQHYMRHSNPKTTEIYLENVKIAEEINTALQLYEYYHTTQD